MTKELKNQKRIQWRKDNKKYCELCKKNVNPDGWNEHLKTKIHLSKTGEYKYKYKDNKKEYYRQIYENNKKIKSQVKTCECGLKYRNDGYRRHIQTKRHIKQLKIKNGDDKYYECSHCGMKTYNRYSYEKHMRNQCKYFKDKDE
jgi:hypothetical protein